MTADAPHAPKFSIIMIDYDGSVNREYVRRAIHSLRVQTLQDFEVLLMHDGPKQTSYEEELNSDELARIDAIHIGEQRKNDWGHSLRDQGMRLAKGDYIVHFNADNVLFPHALERLWFHAHQELPPIFDQQGVIKNSADILIFCIYMRGVVFCNGHYSRRPGQEDTYSTILTGVPTRYRNIDCMQLVMKRERWLEVGGWYDQSRNSDGIMYPELVKQFGARYIPELLGEHW